MKKAIVTTTIYRPDNLFDWARQLNPGDVICVSGDKKTPHDEVRSVLTAIEREHNVETEYVVSSSWRSAQVIGWNSIQRRNVAILNAMTYEPDLITTIDTDNFPVDADYMRAVEYIFSEWRGPEVSSPSGWFNVGDVLVPRVMHRGFPLSQRRSARHNWTVASDDVISMKLSDRTVGVFASLWVGDPDIDAMERITVDPVTSVTCGPDTFTLATDTWCPFNSQATTFRRELFPLLNVWPGVDRMDDIWPSFVARHIMDKLGYAVAYGHPLVRQERHPHDLVSDLEKEIIGYRYTDALIDVIRDVKIDSAAHIITNLEMIYRNITWCDFISDSTMNFMSAWIEDVKGIYTGTSTEVK